MFEYDFQPDHCGLDHQIAKKPQDAEGQKTFLLPHIKRQPNQPRDSPHGKHGSYGISWGMGNRKIVIQIETGRMRKYEQADVKDYHPKLRQHPFCQSKIAALVGSYYYFQGVRAQIHERHNREKNQYPY